MPTSAKIIKKHIVTGAKKENLLLTHYSYEAKNVARIFSIYLENNIL